jgi:hypothetical protein
MLVATVLKDIAHWSHGEQAVSTVVQVEKSSAAGTASKPLCQGKRVEELTQAHMSCESCRFVGMTK